MLRLVLLVLAATLAAISAEILREPPPYIKQCHEGDPKLIDCFIDAIHHLRPYLQKGIPEIELPTVEPFKMDELSLSLTSGPNGYKVSLKDMDVFGASNFTVTKLMLGSGGRPFQAVIKIPKLLITARYTSSGVLIILPASGNGTFNGIFDDVTAVVEGTTSFHRREGEKFMRVDTLSVDLIVKNVRMSVKRIFNNNRILIQATNLFLRENGHEVLKAMNPQLRKKLSVLFASIANKLLAHVPIDLVYVPRKVAKS